MNDTIPDTVPEWPDDDGPVPLPDAGEPKGEDGHSKPNAAERETILHVSQNLMNEAQGMLDILAGFDQSLEQTGLQDPGVDKAREMVAQNIRRSFKWALKLAQKGV